MTDTIVDVIEISELKTLDNYNAPGGKSFPGIAFQAVNGNDYFSYKGEVVTKLAEIQTYKSPLGTLWSINYEVTPKGKNKVTSIEYHSKSAIVVPMPTVPMPANEGVPKEIKTAVTTFGDATRESIESQKRADLINQAWIAGKLPDGDMLIAKLYYWLSKLEPEIVMGINQLKQSKESPLVQEAVKLGAKVTKTIPKAG